MAEPDSWKRFSVVLTGSTNGAHESVLKLFKSSGQKEAKSPGDADYLLVFCPVVSRVGTDVRDALDRLPGDKEAVLVVMHHTFNTELVVPPSSSLVDDQRVRLTLDCLFYRDQLLKSRFNDHMNNDIKEFFKASKSKKGKAVRQADSPADLKLANDPKEENRKLKEQQTVLVQDKETLRVQNEEKDKKIQELENKLQESQNNLQESQNNLQESQNNLQESQNKRQELENNLQESQNKRQELQNNLQDSQNEVAELKQQVSSLVKPGSNVDPGPAADGGESMKHRGAPPPQSEHGTRTSRSKKDSPTPQNRPLDRLNKASKAKSVSKDPLDKEDSGPPDSQSQGIPVPAGSMEDQRTITNV